MIARFPYQRRGASTAFNPPEASEFESAFSTLENSAPRAAGLPPAGDRGCGRSRLENGKQELTDSLAGLGEGQIGLHPDSLDEGLPLHPLQSVLEEFRREGKRLVRAHGCPPPRERCADGAGQRQQVEGEGFRDRLEVVEVLHSAVGDPQNHHGVQFLGHDCFRRIRP